MNEQFVETKLSRKRHDVIMRRYRDHENLYPLPDPTEPDDEDAMFRDEWTVDPRTMRQRWADRIDDIWCAVASVFWDLVRRVRGRP
jgi:hypothetical protein